MRLQNKSAIVTGAAQGLGEALARRLAVEGCDVLLADINLDKARAAADAIERDTGRRTGATQTNVASEADVQAMVDEAVSAFGKLDILVANAGIVRAHDITEMPLSEWQTVMDINLTGYFLCAQAAARAMIPHKSRRHRPDQLQVRQKRLLPQQRLRRLQVRRHRPDPEHRARPRAAQNPRQRRLPRQPARRHPLAEVSLRPVRQNAGPDPRRGPRQVRIAGPAGARLHLRRCRQRRRLPRLRRSLLHDRPGHQRHRRPGNALTCMLITEQGETYHATSSHHRPRSPALTSAHACALCCLPLEAAPRPRNRRAS